MPIKQQSFHFARIVFLLTFFFVIVLIPVGLSQTRLSPNEKPANDFDSLLVQNPTSEIPEILGPNVISTNDHIEMGCTSSPDGEEIYFSRSETSDSDSNWAIYVARRQSGGWTTPEVAPFSGIYRDFNPFITHDGKYMLFYRESFDQAIEQEGTWIVEREGDSWGEPRFLVAQYTVTTEDFKNFYCTAEPRPGMDRDICMMTYRNGVFSEPTHLRGGLNSEWWDSHGCISPDGSYIVFDAQRPSSQDPFDMHVSFRMDGEIWSDALNFTSNFDHSDASMPNLSPDGKFLFFTSNSDLYLVDAKILRTMAPIDVGVEKVKIKPNNPKVGGIVKLTVSLLNRSNYYSAASEISFYLNGEKKIDKKMILLGRADVNSLKPGKKSHIKLNCTIHEKTKPNGYYVIVKFDRDDRNQDPNPVNNTWFSSKKVMIF